MPDLCRTCPVRLRRWHPDRLFLAFQHHAAGMVTPLTGFLEMEGGTSAQAAAQAALSDMQLLQALIAPTLLGTGDTLLTVVAELATAASIPAEASETQLRLRIPALEHAQLEHLSEPWAHPGTPLAVTVGIRAVQHAGGEAHGSCDGTLTLTL